MNPILKSFPTYEIIPRGWMKKQLEIQAESLSGNLHRVWRDVRDSRWIGGDAEGWERVPYWLDGFIPLAFLLRDEEKMAVARKYVDAILDGQQEDGWICPCSFEARKNYDMWALILLSKVLVVWYSATEDERVEQARAAAATSIEAIEDLLRSCLQTLEAIRTGHCPVAPKAEAPEETPEVDAVADIVGEIMSSLDISVDTEEGEPQSEPKHSKLSDHFGPGYDPTKK